MTVEADEQVGKGAKQQQDNSSEVLLAFRLGWTIAEFMGRARQADFEFRKKSQWAVPRDLLGFESHEAPRLSYSDGVSSKESAWWQSALRLVALADALNLLGDGFLNVPTIRSWPESIYQLTYRLPKEPGKQKIERPTEEKWLTPRDYYAMLEPWCRQVDLTLSARGEMASLAFTTGGEIADTCWFMRRRPRGEKRDGRDNSWHKLINHQRLNAVINRLKVFEDRLPSLVGPALRFSLFRWGIAHDLGYKGERLIVEYEWLWHWFHWWPWVMRQRRRLIERRRKRENRPRERKGQGVLQALTEKDEELVCGRLDEQARRWQELILGERLPTNYLDSADRFRIFWQSWLIYIVLLFLSVAAAAGAGYLLVLVLGSWLALAGDWIVSRLTPATTQPATLKESFEIVKIVVPGLAGLVAFAGGVLRDLWHGAAGLYPRVRDWLVRCKVERATWVRWRAKKN
jgi:hypothetical protein